MKLLNGYAFGLISEKMKDKFKPVSFSILIGLLLFFTMPIFIILYYFRIQFDIYFSDLLWAFKNSIIQSVTTAVLCIIWGLGLVPGLARIKKNWIKKIMAVALLPSILPSIFTILIVFSFFRQFPFGHGGIILVFFVTYFGMSTLILYNSYSALIRKYEHLVKIYNIPLRKRYLKIYLPEMAKDILTVFLIIVLGCFSSLSVPLLAGGGRGVNIEVLIYESVFINGQWGTAALMALIQMTIMLALGLYLNQINYMGSGREAMLNSSDRSWNLSLFIFLSSLGMYIFGYFYQVIKSVFKVNWAELYSGEFATALGHSFILAVLAVGIFSILLVGLFYLFYRKVKANILFYFLLPSTTVVGLSLYLLFSERASVLMDALKIALGLNLIYALALYKSYIYPHFSNIKSQLDIARIYNVNFYQSLKSVIWPQLKMPILLGASILTIFSFCEFALIKAAGSQTLFTGIFIERLISSYRLELGFIYSFMVLSLVFVFFSVIRLLNVKD